MDQVRAFFPVGLGVQVPNNDPHRTELTHPINSKLEYSLHVRALGRHEHNQLGKGAALVPHYREREQFPFRNSSSIPDGLSEYATHEIHTTETPDLSRTSYTTFDFSASEHHSMGMDPYENVVPEGIPGLSADSSLTSPSEPVLSSMPHPLGSRLDLWHNTNNQLRSKESTPPRSVDVRRSYPVDMVADDTLCTAKIEYTRKKRLRQPSLLRTPHSVMTADWEEAFKSQWQRGENDPDEGLLMPGLPELPTFPSAGLIVDNVHCDPWGRKQCSAETAVAVLAGCCLFPPVWLLVGAGYADGLVGVLPRTAKIISFGLGLGSFIIAVIITAVLSAA